MNTISTKTYRDKYRSEMLDKLLRRSLVAEAICDVDRSDLKTLQNPYGSNPTAEIQAISGQYVTDDFTTTDDTLTVDHEVIVSEHIYDFEDVLTRFELFASRTEQMIFAVAEKIDYFVVNNLCEDATGAYTTPIGGFTDPINVNEIFANLLGKVAGYSDAYKGLFLVVERTDVPGIIESQAKSGFAFSDQALRYGMYKTPMGIDIYVTGTGTFVDATIGLTTVTNSGHRVFGVKKVATYASPRNIRFEEKSVSGKTGKEIVVWGYVGFKAWATKAELLIDITLS